MDSVLRLSVLSPQYPFHHDSTSFQPSIPRVKAGLSEAGHGVWMENYDCLEPKANKADFLRKKPGITKGFSSKTMNLHRFTPIAL